MVSPQGECSMYEEQCAKKITLFCERGGEGNLQIWEHDNERQKGDVFWDKTREIGQGETMRSLGHEV